MLKKKGSLFRRIFFPLAISLMLGILILSCSIGYTYAKSYVSETLNDTHEAIDILENVLIDDIRIFASDYGNPSDADFRNNYIEYRKEHIKALVKNQSMTINADVFFLYELDCKCETCDDESHYNFHNEDYFKIYTCDCKMCSGHMRDINGNVVACMHCEICLTHQIDVFGNIIPCGCEICSTHRADEHIAILDCGCRVCGSHRVDRNGKILACDCEACRDDEKNKIKILCGCENGKCKHEEEYMSFVQDIPSISEEDREEEVDLGYNLIDFPEEFRSAGDFSVALSGVKKLAITYQTENGKYLKKDLGKIIAINAFKGEDSSDKIVPKVITTTLLGGVIAMVVLFIIVFICTYKASRPISQMTNATKRYAEGDFSERIPVERDDEIGELTTSFNRMATALSITENSRRAFVANVSHELKTPMTTIGGFIDGIVDGTIPPEKQDYYLKIVSSEVKRLSRLVNQMLNLSRIEEGKTQVNPTEFNISKQLVDTILTFEKHIVDKGIGITGLDTLDAIYLYADEDMINQVIYNLVENAIKFTPQNGRIDFHIEETNNNVSISVGNTGDGIPSEQLPRIFERFYKVDSSRSYDKKGAGLGLYLVKTLVELHGGQVNVSSTEGEYTQFSFSLPKKNKENQR